MHSRPIAVFCYFDKDGNVKPIRFKLDEDNLEHVASIEHFIIKAKNNIRIEFACNVLMNNIKHQCEIWYFKQEPHWMLYSMK